MSTLELNLQNIKCDGCVKNITSALEKHDHIKSVLVDKATGKVTITGENLVNSSIVNELTTLGYPEVKKGFISKLFS